MIDVYKLLAALDNQGDRQTGRSFAQLAVLIQKLSEGPYHRAFYILPTHRMQLYVRPMAQEIIKDLGLGSSTATTSTIFFHNLREEDRELVFVTSQKADTPHYFAPTALKDTDHSAQP